MKRVCQAIALTLLAIWVPATLHCQLESLPGLESLLSCCQHEDSPSPAHHAEECAMDSCADLESGLYKLPEHPVVFAPLPVSARVSLNDVSLANPRDLTSERVPAPPPRLAPASWQFVTRAAPSVRAPSFAS